MFQHKSSIEFTTLQSVMSIKQIRQSRALRLQQILFYQFVEIEIVECCR